MSRMVTRKRRRLLSINEVRAFLGISQQRASQLKKEGHFGKPTPEGLFAIDIVRRYAQEARKSAERRALGYEARGWLHVETVAAALGCSVELVLSYSSNIAYAGAGMRMVRSSHLATLRKLLTPTAEGPQL